MFFTKQIQYTEYTEYSGFLVAALYLYLFIVCCTFSRTSSDGFLKEESGILWWLMCCSRESGSMSAAQHRQQSSVSAYTGSVTLNEFSHSAYVHSEAFWQSLEATIKSCSECQCHSFNLGNLVPVLQIKETRLSPGSPSALLGLAHTVILLRQEFTDTFKISILFGGRGTRKGFNIFLILTSIFPY